MQSRHGRVLLANIDIRPEALGEAAASQLLRRIAEPSAPRTRIALGATWEEGPFSAPLGQADQFPATARPRSGQQDAPISVPCYIIR